MVLTPEPAALSRSKESRASGPDPKALIMGTAPSRDNDRVRAVPAIKVSGCDLVPVICGPAFLTRRLKRLSQVLRVTLRGRSIPSSAPTHPARCWLPPRPGPASSCHRVTSGTSGMPAKRPLMPASELARTSQSAEASLGGQQPAGHLAAQSERARQLRLQVPGRAELLERLPGAPRRRRDDRHPAPGRAVRRGGQVATDDRAPWPGRDWQAVGGVRRRSPGDHRNPVISAYLPGGEPEHAVRS
jgi:hypothetical protein